METQWRDINNYTNILTKRQTTTDTLFFVDHSKNPGSDSDVFWGYAVAV